VEVDLLKVRYAQAAECVEKLLSRFNDVRQLTGKELSVYKIGFGNGWEIPGICGKSDYCLRLLLPKGFPFSPPRVAIAPAPPVLSWPHLEEEGILCLLPESAAHSIEDIESVVLTLLEDAQSLVTDSLEDKGGEQFEDEFKNYWGRWVKTEAYMSVLCRPEGPSRWVCAWHSTLGVLIAEEDTILQSWIQNRYSHDKKEKISFQSIPLLWLPRPLRPSEYPLNVGSVFDILGNDHHSKEMFQQLLLDGNAKHKTVLLGFAGGRGVGFAGLRISEPVLHPRSGKALYNGFRNQPPSRIALMRYRSASITGACVTRYDAEWIHGRDHNPQVKALQKKSVIVFGVGSLGSSVAELLAKSGVGSLTLVDPERLTSENIARHTLGVDSVGEKKAIAEAKSLSRRFPHLKVEGFPQTCEVFAQTMYERIQSADLIISTIGEWSAESQLNAMALNSKAFPPILYGWLEPHATSGHAIALFPGSVCLRCIIDGVGKPRVAVTAWSEQGTMLSVPACGGVFQPYGAIELTHVYALVADLALDVMLRQVTSSTYRIWIGQRKLLEKSGGKWSMSWINRQGDPGEGGRMTEISLNKDIECPECGRCF
jgi:molybdopterin/thiamine biosynthesis adenylyltransferase